MLGQLCAAYSGLGANYFVLRISIFIQINDLLLE